MGQAGPVQTIRGVVLERSIGTPLPGATITLPAIGRSVTSDTLGRFRLDGISVGRLMLVVTYAGYRTVTLQNLMIEAGKESVLTIEMEEIAVREREIVIKGRSDKTRPLNEMALVSGRMFSVEETRRFAAGLNDPSRIATGFAGVQSQGDANALIIRGNAPNGLLWRLEGVDVPNPNHFARVGTSGGAISILSAQLLANSDFFTGAFTSEYGNALAGVFDIRLRKGNREKREHTLSVSTIGLDAATEGNFKKGYGGSYLINYRYGFLTLMQKIGFDIGDAPTSFQDLSFNIHLPTRKAGDFSVFGFGGASQQEEIPDRDPVAWTRNTARKNGWLDAARTSATGLTHSIRIGGRTLVRSVLSLNGYEYREQDSRIDRADGPLIVSRNNRFTEINAVGSLTVTHKRNSRHLFRSGVYLTRKGFDLAQREGSGNALLVRVKDQGHTLMTNAFAQWKWTPADRFSLVAGIHGQHLRLNGSSAFDPRLSVRWGLKNGQSLSLGVGHHAQIQPLGNYFARVKVGTDTIQPNRNMGMSRSLHFVLGYGVRFGEHWNLKAEAYYQHLHSIPVTKGRPTTFSMLNQDDDYVIDALENTGTGRNVGLELTFERFWTDHYYFLTTLSLYDSRYLPSDGVWRNTRFNSNAMSTTLLGREWMIKRQRTHTIAADFKMMYGGGVRVTPIDLARSIALNRQITLPYQLYDDKLPPFFRIDLQGEWRVQYGKRTGAFILGVQNLTGRKNPVRQYYDAASKRIQYGYMLGRIPVAGYKMDF
jgi:Carboxypeptidase regulatory-like domain